MCKNCTDQENTQNADLSENNSQSIDCTKTTEKLDRDKFGDAQGDNKGDGCEYCLNQSEFGNFDILKKSWGYELRGYGSGSSETINYCPMCGRKL